MRGLCTVVGCHVTGGCARFVTVTVDMDDYDLPLQAPIESIVKLHPWAKAHKCTENQHVSTAPHSKPPPLQPSTMYYPFISKEDYTIANLAIRKNFTADTINAILSTHHHPGSLVTLKNHTMLFDIIDQAMHTATTVMWFLSLFQFTHTNVHLLCTSLMRPKFQFPTRMKLENIQSSNAQFLAGLKRHSRV